MQAGRMGPRGTQWGQMEARPGDSMYRFRNGLVQLDIFRETGLTGARTRNPHAWGGWTTLRRALRLKLEGMGNIIVV